MNLNDKKVCLKKIKTGDHVEVITGKYKGKRGSVMSVDRIANRISVSGLNMKVHHAKSGVNTKEAPLNASNVMLVDPSNDKPGRIGFKVMENGEKHRVFKKTDHVLDRVSKKAKGDIK